MNAKAPEPRKRDELGRIVADPDHPRQLPPKSRICVRCGENFQVQVVRHGTLYSQAVHCPSCLAWKRTRERSTVDWRRRVVTDPGPLERGMEQRLAIQGYDDGWSGFAPTKRKEGA